MYIIQMIDGLSTGGAEQLQVTFAREAKRFGYKLAVISLDDARGSQYHRQLIELDVEVYFFPTSRLLDVSNLFKIYRLLRAERPDILHTHLTYSYIIGSITASLAGIPVVATLHSTGIDSKTAGTRTEKAEKIVMKHMMNAIMACGPTVATTFQKNIKDVPILVIPNAVSATQIDMVTSERKKLREQISGSADRFIVISVGRLVEQKGFEDLIQAFSILHPLHPNVFLAIVGSGDLRDHLEKKIKDLGLSDHINLLGWRTDVPGLLTASDMFVLSSHWEGLPIAVLEAMSAGLPVLATDVSDNAWAIGEAGVVVPPNQPKLFANAMANLVSDPARCKRLGKAARFRIEEQFDPSDWFNKIISVYQSVLS